MMPYAFPPGALLFRVEPETRSHYFNVYIWPKLGHSRQPSTMRHYIRTYSDCRGINKSHAFTMDFTVGDRGTLPRGLLGQMHFAANCLTTDLITHECLHSALVFGRWKKINGVEIFNRLNPRNEAEERLCYALGRLCYQVVTTAEAYGYL